MFDNLLASKYIYFLNNPPLQRVYILHQK